jgi:hypothetical protein
MRGTYQVNLGVAQRAQEIHQTQGRSLKAEIRRACLRAIRVPDAKQIDGIDITVQRKKIEVVPPTEAVAQ